MAEAAEKANVVTVDKDVYSLGEKLGYGAFSWAVLATRQKDNLKVALKFTKRADSEGRSERAQKRQKQEIQTELNTFKLVRHKNVVALYGYDSDVKYEHGDGKGVSSCYCMALEVCEGGELFDIVYYTGKLEEKVARTVFTQIVDGLQAMHKHGLCHRDIKPQNILLTRQFQVKIADFGSSKIFNRQELMKTFRVGTKGYQAPEVLLRRGYTLKCDIFSLGVLLFVILTKHPPFRQAISEDQWFRQIAKKQFGAFWSKHSKDKLSKQCKDLICKMLCYQPLDRLTIQMVAAHPWTKSDVYSQSQMSKIMNAKKTKATKGRANDSARCPANYNSINSRDSSGLIYKELPAHLDFRAIKCNEAPWKAINHVRDEFVVNNKIGNGTLDKDQCKLTLEVKTQVDLGFKKEGVQQYEEEIVVIEMAGYKVSQDEGEEPIYYLDIAIRTGYSEAAQQMYDMILEKLGMKVKSMEEDALDLTELAGSMTPEEKAEMDKRKKQIEELEQEFDEDMMNLIQQDVIAESEEAKEKKKAKKSGH